VRATYTVPFEPTDLVPAVGQGALALETRLGDPLAERIAAVLNHPETDLAVRAERAFLRALRGGCQAPAGAHATYRDREFHITGAIAAPDGSRVLRGERLAQLGSIAEAEALADGLARDLLGRGGAEILAAAGATIDHPDLYTGPLSGRLFLLPRTLERTSRIAPALREAGAEVVEAQDSDAAAEALGTRIPTAILFPSSGSVAAITDYLARLRDAGARPVVAAMGPASSASAGAAGFPPDIVAPAAEIGAFVQTVTRYVLENGS